MSPTPTASCDQSVVSRLTSGLEPEFPSHTVRYHRSQSVGDGRYPFPDLRPQFGGIADGVRGRPGQKRAGPLDLLLQFLVVGDVAEIESVEKLSELLDRGLAQALRRAVCLVRKAVSQVCDQLDHRLSQHLPDFGVGLGHALGGLLAFVLEHSL